MLKLIPLNVNEEAQTKRRWTKRSMDGVKEFSALKTEAEGCNETSVRLCCTFGRHVPEDKKLSSQRQET